MKRYIVSVIIAVYNAAPYLERTVKSVLSQSIGFENIQLILVDDGSTDGSGEICDNIKSENPDNVIVIHQENEGVSSARNRGLEVATGELVNFLDSDDWWTSNSFKYAKDFLDEHPETDVVSFKMKFFGAREGSHPLNWKYKNGSRVVDLREEPGVVQLSSSSAFFRREAWDNVTFDTRLKYAEDAKAVTYILTKKYKLGLSSEGVYNYRRHTKGEGSAVQNSRQAENWYIPKMKYFIHDILGIIDPETQDIAAYAKYIAMYDLQWHIKSNELEDALNESDRAEYRGLVLDALGKIDDDIIAAQRNLTFFDKFYVLRLKNGLLEKDINSEEVKRLKEKSGLDEGLLTRWSQVSGNKKFVELKGIVRTAVDKRPDRAVLVLSNGTEIECSFNDEKIVEQLFGMNYKYFHGFTCEIPVKQIGDGVTLKIKYLDNGSWIEMEEQRVTGDFQVGKDVESEYYYNKKAGIILQVSEGVINIRKASDEDMKKQESQYIADLRAKYENQPELITEAENIRQKLIAVSPIYDGKKICLIYGAERYDKLDLKNIKTYISKIDRHIKVYFVLKSEKAAEKPEYKKVGKVILEESEEHLPLYIYSDMIMTDVNMKWEPVVKEDMTGFLRSLRVNKIFVTYRRGGYFNK